MSKNGTFVELLKGDLVGELLDNLLFYLKKKQIFQNYKIINNLT